MTVKETVLDRDEMGRVWKERDKVNPGGADDDNADRIRIRRYRKDSSVGQVETAERTGDGVTSLVTLSYETLGRRIEVVDEAGVATRCVYDGENVITESVADGEGWLRRRERDRGHRSGFGRTHGLRSVGFKGRFDYDAALR